MRRFHFSWILWTGAVLSILLIPLPVWTAPAERVIRIEAERFAYTPGEIAVHPGDRVTLEIVATDVVHGFYLDGYNLSVSADPGQTARLTFTAERSGVFRFRCSVPCGNLHPFMIGRLRIGNDEWLYRVAVLALMGLAAVYWSVRRSHG